MKFILARFCHEVESGGNAWDCLYRAVGESCAGRLSRGKTSQLIGCGGGVWADWLEMPAVQARVREDSEVAEARG